VIPTNHGPMQPEGIFDFLLFVNYSHNRGLGITPEGFKKMGFPNVDAFEAKYQAEIAIKHAARASNDHSNAVGGDAQAGGTKEKA
jgi:hypothetical protein